MAQQQAMHSSPLRLQPPAVIKSSKGPTGPPLYNTTFIQSAMPSLFESDGDKHEVVRGKITRLSSEITSMGHFLKLLPQSYPKVLKRH